MKKYILLPLQVLWICFSFAQWQQSTFPRGEIRMLYGDERTIFAAIDSSLLYRLDNGSTTWQLSNTGLPTDSHIDLGAMTGKGDTLFACLQWGYNNSPSNGVYRSTDHGATWLELTNGIENNSYPWVYISGNTLFTAGKKFYRSTDWGNSWTDISTQTGNQTVYVIAARNDTVILGPSGQNCTIYYSTDNGSNWSSVAASGLPQYTRFNYLFALPSGNLFGMTYYPVKFFLSTDKGQSWTEVTATGFPTENYPTKDRMYMSPNGELYMYLYFDASNMGSQLYKSTDEGKTWSVCIDSIPYSAGGRSNGYVITSSKYYFGTDAGVFSTETGALWLDISNGIRYNGNVSLIQVAGGKLYARTNMGIFQSSDNGATWVKQTLFPYLQQVIESNNKIYVLSNKTYSSTDNGASWQIDSSFASTPTFLYTTGSELYAYVYTDRLRLMKSTNGGQDWVSTNCMNYFSSISGMTSDQSTLYVWKYDSVGYSTDGGDTWTKMSKTGLPTSCSFSEAVAFGNALYIGVSSSTIKGVYRTTDKGSNWSRVTSGLPTTVSNIQQFSIIKGKIFMICNQGVYYSDNGQAWTSYNEGLPQKVLSHLYTLAYLNDILYLGTYDHAYFTRSAAGLVGVKEDLTGVHPEDFQLHQNYPNPFNPSTTIRYTLPVASAVKLSIFDVLGREVAILVNEQHRQAGSYVEQWNADGFSSGVYFYRLQVNGKILTKRMLLLR